jgi:hypothetical protein
MATPKKDSTKPSVKVDDLTPKKNPKGGRDASTGLPAGKRQYEPIKA